MRAQQSRLALIACVTAVLALSAEPRTNADPGDRAVSVAAVDESEVRAWDLRVSRMVESGALRPRRVDDDTLIAGVLHERLDQYHEGVRVFGGDVVRSRTLDRTMSIFGRIYPDVDVHTVPALSVDEARAAAVAALGEDLRWIGEPELMVYPRDDRSYALVHRLRGFTGSDLLAVLVNAQSGEIELRYSDLQTQAAVGTGTGVLGDRKKVSTYREGSLYYTFDGLRPPELVTFNLRGNLDRALDVITGQVAPVVSDIGSDADNAWTDPPLVDGHVYLGWTYDFIFKRFGRMGLDGNEAPMRALVHPVSRNDLNHWLDTAPEVVPLFYANAFWCGACTVDGRGVMVFGEGLPAGYYVVASGQYVDYLAGALDIIAHELAHGITDYSSELIYRNESGALSEVFSDIIGTGTEFYFQNTGSGQGQADYLVGEDVFRPAMPGATRGIRSMADPQAFGQPDHYSRRYLGSDDNGGVHVNSGIANNAFYLAIEGGRNRTSGLSVQGVGAANREQIEKPFFRAFVYLLPSNATFSLARRATIQAARDLYGGGSPAERAITEAWTAVGVS